jgi:hypothetical protein
VIARSRSGLLQTGSSEASLRDTCRGGFQGTPPGKLRIVDKRAVRVATNQSTFRSANEQIEGAARDLADSLTVQLIPFLCECADDRCTKVIQLTLEEYEIVRASPRRFAVTPGHEAAFADEQVISRTGRFTTVEKVGEAGQMVAESDPR